MAVESTGVTVGTSITAVSGPFISSKVVYLQSGTEGAATYVGGSDVSAANGILLSETNNADFRRTQMTPCTASLTPLAL
jgi:hypothetical protein